CALAPPALISHHPAPPSVCTLSLHDALPIYWAASFRWCSPWPSRWGCWRHWPRWSDPSDRSAPHCSPVASWPSPGSWRLCSPPRSEEHTSELQSRENLVCRLLLEKKNTTRSD